MRKNNWYVITGAPHSGKTSVIELLDKAGHKVVYEAARVYIDQEIEKGKKIEEIRKDELKFQDGILNKKIEIEKELNPKEMIFFDRAIPDSEAYYNLLGVDNIQYPENILEKCFYKKVFLFELLPYKKDYARIESSKEQIKLQKLLREAYEKLELPVVMVPIMNSKEDRLKFILNNL